MGPRSIALLSGGLDSSTLVALLKRREAKQVTVLSVVYGQRHVHELAAAGRVALALGVEHVVVDLSAALGPVFQGARSSQVGDLIDVPSGHYSADNMAITVVPNRNMLLLSVAGAMAVSRSACEVAYAAHAGDHAQYPDCRPEFIESCTETLYQATADAVKLYAPFRNRMKSEIVALGAELGVPFGLTWSCYNPQPSREIPGGVVHCGRCGTCVERAEAFNLAGVPDPTVYADPDFWREACRNGQ
jgi:7-cyano-7-deazaguanine synthase